MGKTCEPKAFSFQCMTELTTNKTKKKKLDIFRKNLRNNCSVLSTMLRGIKINITESLSIMDSVS